MKIKGWAMVSWHENSWEELRWQMRRDEKRWEVMRWGEEISDEITWDEVWSAQCGVWPLANKQSVALQHCILLRCSVAVCGLCSWTTTMYRFCANHARTGLGGAQRAQVLHVKKVLWVMFLDNSSAPLSTKQACTHGAGWRTAHASSIDEKGLLVKHVKP